MSAISLTRLYEFLIPKLGKEATESFITFSESKIKSEVENYWKQLATKEDIASVKADIVLIRQDLARIEGKLVSQIIESKVEVLRWTFIFITTAVSATVLLIQLYLSK